MAGLAGELDAGQRALDQASWGAARASFEAVLAVGESAQAREGLGLAWWFLGEVAQGISSRERAVELYAHAGRCDDAARTAVWVSINTSPGVGSRLRGGGWLEQSGCSKASANVRATAGSRSSEPGTHPAWRNRSRTRVGP